MHYIASLTLAAIALLFPFQAAAQQTEFDRAAALYNSGNSAQALPLLEKLSKAEEHAANAEVHNLLGLSYFEQSKMNSAVRSFEKAVKLSPHKAAYWANLAFAGLTAGKKKTAKQSADEALRIDGKNAIALSVLGYMELWDGKPQIAQEYAERSIAANSEWMPAHLLRSDSLLINLGEKVQKGSSIRKEIALLEQAMQGLNAAMKLAGNAKSVEPLRTKYADIAGFFDHYSKPANDPAKAGSAPDPSVTPIKILKKPAAVYSESGRSAGVSGAVRLVVMLKADGTIGPILKLWGIGYGLDEQAIAAARRIQFTPKMRNGVPESTAVQIEYTFEIR
jgi:TonB family protein